MSDFCLPDGSRCKKKIIEDLLNDLFTNGCGEVAERLVLTSRDGHDLGGWCRAAVRDVLLRRLEEMRHA